MPALIALLIEPSDIWFEPDVEAVLPLDSDDPWVEAVQQVLINVSNEHTVIIALPEHPLNVSFYERTLFGVLGSLNELGLRWRLRWWTVRRDGRLILAFIGVEEHD